MPYIRTPNTNNFKRNTVSDPENLGAKSGPANTAGSRGGGAGGRTTRTGTPRTSTNTKPPARRTSRGGRMTPKKKQHELLYNDMMSQIHDRHIDTKLSKKNVNPSKRTKAGRAGKSVIDIEQY